MILSLSYGPYFLNLGRPHVEVTQPGTIAFSLESEEVGGFVPLRELLNANLTPSQRGVALRSSVVGVGELGCALVQICFSNILYLHSKVIYGQYLEINQGKCFFYKCQPPNKTELLFPVTSLNS